MRKILLLLFSVCLISSGFAMKKDKPKNYIVCTSATYVHAEGGIRKVGDVYDFTIKTLAENIIIDSVWFGATPVPCDMFEKTSNHKTTLASKNSLYSIRANKNLYENFPGVADSTNAFKNFKAPFKFKGDAVIMYLCKGKRFYKIVSGVKLVKAKEYR